MEDPQFETVLSMMRLLDSLDEAMHRTWRRTSRRTHVGHRERLLLKFLSGYPNFAADGIARFLDLPPRTVDTMLRRLARTGFIACSRDLAHPTLRLYSLTSKGRRFAESQAGSVEEALRSAIRSLPDDTVASAQTLLLVLSSQMRMSARPSRAPSAAGRSRASCSPSRRSRS